jgi:hypothetical protein
MAFSSLRNVIHRKPRLRWAKRRSSDRQASAGIRPRVELLEDRTLLSFAAPVNYVTGSRPTFVLRGNFTADAIPDLAVANSGTPSNSIAVLPGNANGTFQTPAKTSLPAARTLSSWPWRTSTMTASKT